MAQIYYEGQTKIRPGVYQRYSGEQTVEQGSYDGFVAFIMNADWGETGKVTKHGSIATVREAYGENDATAAVEQIFKGGASTVYCYRLAGTGGVKATITADTKIIFTAKHVGNVSLSVKLQAKLGDSTKNQLVVMKGTKVVETFEYTVPEGSDLDAIVTAMASSGYVTAAKATSATGSLTAGTYALTGGVNPTVANSDYAAAVTEFEPYYYNVIAADSISSGVQSVLRAYVESVEADGKNIMTVIGDTTDTAFATRAAAAAACNSEKVVYFGSGWIDADGNSIKGVKAVAYVAGAVAATPSSRAITRMQINGAADIIERLTNGQYETAIENGLLLASVGPSNQVWFDSGINTLINPKSNQDNGWKKIKRVKVRYELMKRIDNILSPKIGVVPANADGVAYLVQCGQGIVNTMIGEGKLSQGSFFEDPDNPLNADSVWFIIDAYDVDSLEKIYLHYKFHYSQNA